MHLLRCAGFAAVLWMCLGGSSSARLSSPCPSLSQPADQCPNGNLDPKLNYSHQKLWHPNFAGADLKNANFEGATLIGANFVRANLEGASFKNATFQRGDSLSGTDFTLANLKKACFMGAKFEDVTYFTYAITACADFSKTDIRTERKGDAITKAVLFGEDGLQGSYNACECRTRFQYTKMSCEFMSNWPALDLDHADISECLPRMKGMNFGGVNPGVTLRGVDFSGGASCDSGKRTDLRGTRWQGVDLTGAVFTGAILDGANFAATQTEAGATLTDANMVCISAKGASFDGTKLGKNEQGRAGAKLDRAKLTDVTFRGVDLVGTSWAGAKLETVDLQNATLDGSSWEGATLESLDLSRVTSALGANFTNATLTSANLKNTKLGRNVYKATGTRTSQPSSLVNASLCGATLDLTDLTCANLTGAKLTKEAGCDRPATIVKDTNGKYSPKTEGVAGDGDDGCSTTCPNGSAGPCAKDGQWSAPPPDDGDKCCPTKPCKPGLKPNKPCTSDCDCHSRQCVNGLCG